MPRPNPSHSDDWLDAEIDSLVRSVETDEPEVVAAPSAADRAVARWFRRSAVDPIHRRRRRRLAPQRPWTETRAFFATRRADLDFGFYALAVAASLILGVLIALLGKP
ncbi:MAG TPA: hypothetical protein VF232_05170 [Gaiellaceae bacterium]